MAERHRAGLVERKRLDGPHKDGWITWLRARAAEVLHPFQLLLQLSPCLLLYAIASYCTGRLWPPCALLASMPVMESALSLTCEQARELWLSCPFRLSLPSPPAGCPSPLPGAPEPQGLLSGGWVYLWAT